MTTNLIELTKRYLTPEVTIRASGLVGESPNATRRGLDTAVATIVGKLAEHGSSASESRTLMGILEEARLIGAGGPLSERLGAMSGEELVVLGKGLLGTIFGSRLGTIVDGARAIAGVKSSSMSSLFGLAAPIVLGVLGDEIHARRLDASGLAALLGEQRGFAASALSEIVSEGDAERAAPRTQPEAAAARAPAPTGVRPVAEPSAAARWGLLAAALGLVLGVTLGRRHMRTTRQVPSQSLGAGITREPPAVEPPRVAGVPAPPAEPSPSRAASSGVGELNQYLDATTGEASKRFVLEDMTFEFATTHLMPKSLATLDQLAQTLRAHPNAHVRIEGHTDDLGLPAANEKMSIARANAVKNALVARGVSGDRITTNGLGQADPIAPNDTAAGRAKNRRIEVVVTR
jgi:outer membrane protein OmpA-like peptidoglycan-associated protein